MFKSTLFKMATPVVCALSMAFTSLSAAPYYGNNCADDCCDPCQNKRGWWKDAAIFVGSAAVGAIAGVAAANANKSRGKRGEIGPQGPQGNTGTTGTAGTPGIGFTPAVVPPGQPNAGAPVTSLTFTFTTLAALTLVDGGIQAYVTTPDGRTILGTTFTGLLGSTATVTINTGPFYSGQYDPGIILPAALVSLAGLVSVEITNINGAATTGALDSAGIIAAATVLSGSDKFFNVTYPFPETP